MKRYLQHLGRAAGLTSLVAAAWIAPASAAGQPTIAASVTNAQVSNGKTVRVNLELQPDGTSVNTVNVDVHFPADKLSFIGIDKAGAYFDTFIPSAPIAKSGEVTFAATSLQKGATTDDATIGGLLFKATGSDGSATISLDGSQTADDGQAIDTATSDAYLTFSGQSNSNEKAFRIQSVGVSGVTITGAKVSWQTDTATTGTVNYGTTKSYGFSVSADAGANHVVDLGKLFAGRSIVHYQIVAVNADGQVSTSPDQTFVTAGYPVAITVVDNSKKPAAGISVHLDGQVVKSDSQGVATLTNIAPGSQKVVVGGGRSQVIVVKDTIGDAASKPQLYTLTATRSATPIVGSVLLLAALVIGVLLTLIKQPRKQKQKSEKS